MSDLVVLGVDERMRRDSGVDDDYDYVRCCWYYPGGGDDDDGVYGCSEIV